MTTGRMKLMFLSTETRLLEDARILRVTANAAEKSAQEAEKLLAISLLEVILEEAGVWAWDSVALHRWNTADNHAHHNQHDLRFERVMDDIATLRGDDAEDSSELLEWIIADYKEATS
jgi:hypothetical protein